MKTGLNISGGQITKESAEAASKAVIDVLEAALQHHNPEVTLAALGAITKSLDSSVSNMNISDCSFNSTSAAKKKERHESK